jgi:carboxypeptidase C (cathepsin A)
MKKTMKILNAFFLFILCLSILPVLASESPPKEDSTRTIPQPKHFLTKGNLIIGKNPLDYTTHASEIYIKDEKGKPCASIFSFAYFKDGVKDLSHRPISFVFNGGPGSSSVWLHMGLLGPMRINVPSDGTDAGAPPYPLESNHFSLLDVTDLVFIDPVGTGFSHALDKNEDKDFWGVDRDASSTAEFIRLFITKYKRWNSPKYIIGESYGSIRAALLVGELQQYFTGIALNGVMLISPALDTKTFMFLNGNEIPFVTYLPSYAAGAWYHNKLPQKPDDFEVFLQEIRDFATNEYLIALFKGDSLDEEKKSHIINKLHQYTGLDKTYLRRTNLRIDSSRFLKELLRDRGLVLGRADCRYLGKDPDDAGEYADIDPEAAGVDGAFIASINDYMGRVLKVNLERKYEILNLNANYSWKRPGNYRHVFSGFMNVIPILAKGVAENKDLRIFVANGYFDLTTAFFSAEYMFNHSGIPKDRITMKCYKGGHMMYTHKPSCEELAEHLRNFISEGKK